MNVGLTDNDISVLKSLLRDGRKSFRQISREIGISTPTVKARFLRLLNMGVIKSISPILDLNKLSYRTKRKFEIDANLDIMSRHGKQARVINKMMSGLRSDELVKLLVHCDYCKTPLFSKMFMLKFANFERYFCCKECKSAYKKRNAGRIEAIVKKYQKSKRRNVSM